MITRDLQQVIAVRLRTEPAAWLLSLSCAIGYLAALGFEEQSPGYPLAVAIRGHGAIIVLAPISAGCAAWKAGRFRRARWPRRTWRRSPARLALAEIATTAAVQMVAYAVVVAAVAASSTGSGLPWEPELVLVAAAALLGWSAIGFVIGWYLRSELAMPVVVIGSYLTIVLPDAIEPLWVRHLTGTCLGCCFQDAVLAPGAVRGPAILAIGVAIAALLLVAAQRRLVLVAGALLVVAVATLVSVGQVDLLGADPIAPRTGALRCAGSAPSVCTWPEQARDRQQIEAVATTAFGRWRSAGLGAPDRVSPRPFADGTPTIVVQFPDDPTDDEIIAALAFGAVPEPDCPGGAPTDLYMAREVAWAHVAIEGGLPDDAVYRGVDPDIAQQVRDLRAAPAADRHAWLGGVLQAVTACADSVPGVPG